jgi:hypothetical protein
MWVINLRGVRLKGHVACVGEELNTYGALVGKTEVKNPYGRHTPRSQNDIKLELKAM